MSFEGDWEWLCENGHYFCSDVYSCELDDKANWRCPHCGTGFAWRHLVDHTNGEGEYAKLEVGVPAKICECAECGNKHATTVPIYKIPPEEPEVDTEEINQHLDSSVGQL